MQIIKKLIIAVLRIEAKAVLRKYKPQIILVTGSIGKTSTKDAIFAVLSKFSSARKSEKSYNSEIGIPLSILGISSAWRNPLVWIINLIKGALLIIRRDGNYPKWLVLEVGARKPGDILSSAGWIKADIIVITSIGTTPPHIEFYKSLQDLVSEKFSLTNCLKPEGTLILNADDPIVFDLRNKTNSKIISFGEAKEATVNVSEFSIKHTDATGAPEGLVFNVNIAKTTTKVSMRFIFGKNHMYSALAAFAVAHVLKFNLKKVNMALGAYEVPSGRQRLIDGIHGSFIIDDSYNSSPLAVSSAIETLSNITSKGRKIVVLGDMLELGKFTEEAHKRVGEQVVSLASILITVGIRAKYIYASAISHGMKKISVKHFATAEEAGVYLKNKIEKGDIILVKGSQIMRMERIVKMIMAHPELAHRLLVRQEKEWLTR